MLIAVEGQSTALCVARDGRDGSEVSSSRAWSSLKGGSLLEGPDRGGAV